MSGDSGLSESDCPISTWTCDTVTTDGPTLTMTLPPLLLHTTSVQQQQSLYQLAAH